MATPTSDYPASSVAGQVETAEGDCACLTFEVLDEKQAIRSVSDNGAGATVLFSGTTRDNFQGKQVARLEYEAYSALALKSLQSLLQDAHTPKPFPEGTTPQPITRVYIAHRLGVVPVGETSIVIAVSSPHRKEAFVVAEWLLEEVKRNVAIWKREVYSDGRAIVAQDGESSLATEPSAWKANFA